MGKGWACWAQQEYPATSFPYVPKEVEWKQAEPGEFDKPSGEGVLLAKSLYQVASQVWAVIQNFV